MKTSIKKSSLKVLFGIFVFLMAFATASCQKDEVSPKTESPNITTDVQSIDALKSAECDTIKFSGKYDGVRYNNFVIVIDRTNCTFYIEGDVVIDGVTYHISGFGEIKTRSFNGTVTDSDGNNVPLTDYWKNIVFKAIDLTGFVEQQIMNSVESL